MSEYKELIKDTMIAFGSEIKPEKLTSKAGEKLNNQAIQFKERLINQHQLAEKSKSLQSLPWRISSINFPEQVCVCSFATWSASSYQAVSHCGR